MTQHQLVKVRDVMKTSFDMVDGMATVSEALETMKNVETKCLLVNKRNEQDEYGIVIISDIARLVLAKDRAPERVNIYEIMTKPVATVHADMDIRYCARFFTHFGLTRAPVVEGDKLVGIVSLTDLVIKGMRR